MQPLPPMWYIVLAALLSALTVTGNGIVICLIVTKQRLHNPANWIILSLAIADVSLGAGYLLTQCLIRPDTNLRYSILSFLSAASALNLCLLTLDRYIFITKPLRYFTLMTTKKVVLLIITAWMASFLPHFVFYLKADILTSPEDPNDFKRFATFDFAVFEILPMVALAFTAARIFCVVRRQSRRRKIQMTQLHFNHLGTEHNREAPTANPERAFSMKVICVAVTVFFLCYFLELIFTINDQLAPKKPKLREYRFILSLFYNVNSAINPVAYALFKRDIRKNLGRVFRYSEEVTKLEARQGNKKELRVQTNSV